MRLRPQHRGGTEDSETSDATDTGSTSEPGTSTGADPTDPTDGDLECTFEFANPPELRADVVIMVDPTAQVAWPGLMEGIAASVPVGANVAVLLPPGQSTEVIDPPCLSCGGRECEADVRLLKIVYEESSALEAVSNADISCLFSDAPGPPRVRHYWLLTDNLDQTVPGAFASLVNTSDARFHVSSPDGSKAGAGSQVAALVEGTFGSDGPSDVYDELLNQVRLVASRRLACAWAVDPVPGDLPFFGLNNNYIESEVGKAGVVGSPVAGLGACSDDIVLELGLDGIPFEFYYEELDRQTVAAACPIACAFIQLEPADDTGLIDLYCGPT